MNVKRKYRIIRELRYYVDDAYKFKCMYDYLSPLPSEKVYVPEFLSLDGSWDRWIQKPLRYRKQQPVFFERKKDAETFIRKEHDEFVKQHENHDDECVEEFEL